MIVPDHGATGDTLHSAVLGASSRARVTQRSMLPVVAADLAYRSPSQHPQLHRCCHASGDRRRNGTDESTGCTQRNPLPTEMKCSPDQCPRTEPMTTARRSRANAAVNPPTVPRAVDHTVDGSGSGDQTPVKLAFSLNSISDEADPLVATQPSVFAPSGVDGATRGFAGDRTTPLRQLRPQLASQALDGGHTPPYQPLSLAFDGKHRDERVKPHQLSKPTSNAGETGRPADCTSSETAGSGSCSLDSGVGFTTVLQDTPLMAFMDARSCEAPGTMTGGGITPLSPAQLCEQWPSPPPRREDATEATPGDHGRPPVSLESEFLRASLTTLSPSDAARLPSLVPKRGGIAGPERRRRWDDSVAHDEAPMPHAHGGGHSALSVPPALRGHHHRRHRGTVDAHGRSVTHEPEEDEAVVPGQHLSGPTASSDGVELWVPSSGRGSSQRHTVEGHDDENDDDEEDCYSSERRDSKMETMVFHLSPSGSFPAPSLMASALVLPGATPISLSPWAGGSSSTVPRKLLLELSAGRGGGWQPSSEECGADLQSQLERLATGEEALFPVEHRRNDAKSVSPVSPSTQTATALTTPSYTTLAASSICASDQTFPTPMSGSQGASHGGDIRGGILQFTEVFQPDSASVASSAPWKSHRAETMYPATTEGSRSLYSGIARDWEAPALSPFTPAAGASRVVLWDSAGGTRGPDFLVAVGATGAIVEAETQHPPQGTNTSTVETPTKYLSASMARMSPAQDSITWEHSKAGLSMTEGTSGVNATVLTGTADGGSPVRLSALNGTTDALGSPLGVQRTPCRMMSPPATPQKRMRPPPSHAMTPLRSPGDFRGELYRSTSSGSHARYTSGSHSRVMSLSPGQSRRAAPQHGVPIAFQLSPSLSERQSLARPLRLLSTTAHAGESGGICSPTPSAFVVSPHPTPSSFSPALRAANVHSKARHGGSPSLSLGASRRRLSLSLCGSQSALSRCGAQPAHPLVSPMDLGLSYGGRVHGDRSSHARADGSMTPEDFGRDRDETGRISGQAPYGSAAGTRRIDLLLPNRNPFSPARGGMHCTWLELAGDIFPEAEACVSGVEAARGADSDEAPGAQRREGTAPVPGCRTAVRADATVVIYMQTIPVSKQQMSRSVSSARRMCPGSAWGDDSHHSSTGSKGHPSSSPPAAMSAVVGATATPETGGVARGAPDDIATPRPREPSAAESPVIERDLFDAQRDRPELAPRGAAAGASESAQELIPRHPALSPPLSTSATLSSSGRTKHMRSIWSLTRENVHAHSSDWGTTLAAEIALHATPVGRQLFSAHDIADAEGQADDIAGDAQQPRHLGLSHGSLHGHRDGGDSSTRLQGPTPSGCAASTAQPVLREESAEPAMGERHASAPLGGPRPRSTEFAEEQSEWGVSPFERPCTNAWVDPRGVGTASFPCCRTSPAHDTAAVAATLARSLATWSPERRPQGRQPVVPSSSPPSTSIECQADDASRGPTTSIQVPRSYAAGGAVVSDHRQTPTTAASRTGSLCSEEGDGEACFTSAHWRNSFEYEMEPGDRFRSHHRYQFLNVLPWRPRGPHGELQVGFVPLHVDRNGTMWLATSRVDGQQYCVKEVPAVSPAEAIRAELMCYTVGFESGNPQEPAPQPPCPFLVRYYTISRCDLTSVLLLQTEYFPLGTVAEWLLKPFHDRLQRGDGGAADSLAPRTPPPHVEEEDAAACAGALWAASDQQLLLVVQHGLLALQALHRAELVHGNPLPFNVFAFTPRHFKLGNFGSAVHRPSAYPAGTPALFLPLAGTALDPFRTDIHVFAAGLLHLLYRCCKCAGAIRSQRPSLQPQGTPCAPCPLAPCADRSFYVMKYFDDHRQRGTHTYSPRLFAVLHAAIDGVALPQLLRMLVDPSLSSMPYAALQRPDLWQERRTLDLEVATLQRRITAVRQKLQDAGVRAGRPRGAKHNAGPRASDPERSSPRTPPCPVHLNGTSSLQASPCRLPDGRSRSHWAPWPDADPRSVPSGGQGSPLQLPQPRATRDIAAEVEAHVLSRGGAARGLPDPYADEAVPSTALRNTSPWQLSSSTPFHRGDRAGVRCLEVVHRTAPQSGSPRYCDPDGRDVIHREDARLSLIQMLSLPKHSQLPRSTPARSASSPTGHAAAVAVSSTPTAERLTRRRRTCLSPHAAGQYPGVDRAACDSGLAAPHGPSVTAIGTSHTSESDLSGSGMSRPVHVAEPIPQHLYHTSSLLEEHRRIAKSLRNSEVDLVAARERNQTRVREQVQRLVRQHPTGDAELVWLLREIDGIMRSRSTPRTPRPATSESTSSDTAHVRRRHPSPWSPSQRPWTSQEL